MLKVIINFVIINSVIIFKIKSQKLQAMVLAWENVQEVFVMLIFILLLLFFICQCSSFTFSFQHHPSHLHGLSLSFYTHFVLSAQPITEWFVTLSFSTILLSSYHKGYGFEWAFFTHRRFLPYTPSQHFGTTCFYQGFTRSRQLLSWKLQGFILIVETQTQPICLFDSQ